MFYEEQVINGVLCWRGNPDDEWTPCTPEEITSRLEAMRAHSKMWHAEAIRLATKYGEDTFYSPK